MTAKNIVGARVKAIRLALRPACSQSDLSGRLAARGVRIDRSAIARLERGQRYVMDYELIALAQALRVPIGKLLGI